MFSVCLWDIYNTAVTLRLLQRRPEKRGKVQLRPLIVPADISLLQRVQQHQEKQRKKQRQERASIERFVLESVMGAAAKPMGEKTSKAKIRAANAKIPGMAEPVPPCRNTSNERGEVTLPNSRKRDPPAGRNTAVDSAKTTSADARSTRKEAGKSQAHKRS